MQQQYSDALSAFREAVRLDPNLSDAHLGMGWTYLALEDISSALKVYNILKNLNEDDAKTLFEWIYP